MKPTVSGRFLLLVGAVGLGVAVGSPPARAADLGAYPLLAPVELPATGPVRIVLPADAVGTEEGDLANTVVLVNGEGQDVAYAVVPAQDPSPETEHLFFRPVARNTWLTDGAARPLDALRLTFDDLAEDGPFRVLVEAPFNGGFRPIGPETVFYSLDDPEGGTIEMTRVAVGGATGPFRVTASPLRRQEPSLDFAMGEVRADGVVAPIVERVDVGEPVLTTEGRSRWTVPLAGPRRVLGLRFEVDGDVFRRHVYAGVPGPDGETSLPDVGLIRRVAIADARVDRVTVENLDIRGDTLLIDIDTDRGRPLPLRAVEVSSPGIALVARDAGPGPHTLYLGAREGQPRYDLDVAAFELLRLNPRAVAPGAVVPNPAYTPLPTREGVDAPGPVVNLARFRWSRPVTATPGWTRVTLDRAVLAHARVDLGDLRIVDTEGRQIPYVLRATNVGVPWETPPFTRAEQGAHSLLRVPLGETTGDAGSPVATVTLETGADTFTRQVVVLRDRGQMTEEVRHVTWQGSDQGGTLTLGIHDRLGKELLLRIENGDNPPLPVTAVRVTAPAWELRFRQPEGGATLIYGAPAEGRPAYDLAQLEAEVRRIVPTTGTLGAELASGGPQLSGFDKVIVLGGIGLLVVGLVAMTVRVLATSPTEEPGGEVA